MHGISEAGYVGESGVIPDIGLSMIGRLPGILSLENLNKYNWAFLAVLCIVVIRSRDMYKQLHFCFFPGAGT